MECLASITLFLCSLSFLWSRSGGGRTADPSAARACPFQGVETQGSTLFSHTYAIVRLLARAAHPKSHKPTCGCGMGNHRRQVGVHAQEVSRRGELQSRNRQAPDDSSFLPVAKNQVCEKRNIYIKKVRPQPRPRARPSKKKRLTAARPEESKNKTNKQQNTCVSFFWKVSRDYSRDRPRPWPSLAYISFL